MHDQFDLAVSCESALAVAAYERALDAHLHAWPGVLDALQEALDDTPDFALAHALRALVLAGRGQGADAREALGRARAARQLHAREQSQVDLIATIIEGRTRDALQALTVHAGAYPLDVLAVSTAVGAYGLFAFSGRADHDRARLEFLESLAPHYPAGFAWLLAYRGWARIEAGRIEEGMAMAQRAIALRPRNAHNAHMVMHGFHEAGQPREALDFLARWLPCYDNTALMWGHLQWHAALAQIELGRNEEAVRLLTGAILAHLPHGTPFMGLADSVSLLWRLGLRGMTGLPWRIAEQHAARHYPAGSNVFGELHLAMLAAVRRDRNELDSVRRRLRAIADAGHEGAAVAIRWVEGLRALIEDDCAAARDHLDACLGEAPRLGGSHAQRGIIEQTRAALRAPSLMSSTEVR